MYRGGGNLSGGLKTHTCVNKILTTVLRKALEKRAVRDLRSLQWTSLSAVAMLTGEKTSGDPVHAILPS